ncbi:energy transducer TonB [Flavobacterium sp. HNIBRBA15423]|uniref:energy transducer TonB n=1 Tax=Flavobacterium sp. HNIBRBA15423 TaxID=3458683 RepID=UPI00404481CC
MRAKEDFKKKMKNSFIYFQLGLIAAMLVALFVLEFNFKDSKKKSVCQFPPIVTIEPGFEYRLADVKPIEPKVTPKPKVNVVVPKLVLPILNDVDVVDNNKVLEKEKNATQDNSQATENQVETNTSPVNTVGTVEGPVAPPTMLTVEQLPMFKACKGLKRSEQKACFDEQLAKVISKNLTYPERDYENRKQGTALIEFIIDENGNITNVKPLENNRSTEDMKKAAEKAVKRIPQLIPAKQGNKNVRIKYAIPITFKLN